MPQGEKNKLTNRQKTEIFDLKGQISAYKVAKFYNISHTMVYNIWKQKPPKSHREALRKIENELNKARGLPMSSGVFSMWKNIYVTTTEALEEP